MLKRTLQAISAANAHSRADLAQRLEVSEGLLALMMEDLARKGYLEAVPVAPGGSSGCHGSCQSCKACACGESTEQHVWVLTEKGLNAAKAEKSLEYDGQVGRLTA